MLASVHLAYDRIQIDAERDRGAIGHVHQVREVLCTCGVFHLAHLFAQQRLALLRLR
jgi:hypothetical protein